MDSQIRNTGQKRLRAAFKDENGNPARIDGVPQWSSSDTELLTVTPSADGLECLVKGTGELPDPPDGVVTVSVAADVNLGRGVKTVQATIDYHIVDANAKLIELSEEDAGDNPDLAGGAGAGAGGTGGSGGDGGNGG